MVWFSSDEMIWYGLVQRIWVLSSPDEMIWYGLLQIGRFDLVNIR
jgi:hypothetical protein